jgi:hypothetical protein
VQRLVHWASSVHDEQRAHRRLFTASHVPAGGAYLRIEIHPLPANGLDLVISMVLQVPYGFDVAIDYGHLVFREGRWISQDIIGRETFNKPAGYPLSFITFAVVGASTTYLIRGDSAFGMRTRCYMSVDEAESRLVDATDALTGFRARGLFHLDPRAER